MSLSPKSEASQRFGGYGEFMGYRQLGIRAQPALRRQEAWLLRRVRSDPTPSRPAIPDVREPAPRSGSTDRTATANRLHAFNRSEIKYLVSDRTDQQACYEKSGLGWGTLT